MKSQEEVLRIQAEMWDTLNGGSESPSSESSGDELESIGSQADDLEEDVESGQRQETVTLLLLPIRRNPGVPWIYSPDAHDNATEYRLEREKQPSDI